MAAIKSLNIVQALKIICRSTRESSPINASFVPKLTQLMEIEKITREDILI